MSADPFNFSVAGSDDTDLMQLNDGVDELNDGLDELNEQWEDVDDQQQGNNLVQPSSDVHDSKSELSDEFLSDINDDDNDSSDTPLTPLTPVSGYQQTQQSTQQLGALPLDTLEQQCVELTRLCQRSMSQLSDIVPTDEQQHKVVVTQTIDEFFKLCSIVRYSLQYHTIHQHTVRTYKNNTHSDNMKLSVAKRKLQLLQQQYHTLQSSTQSDIT